MWIAKIMLSALHRVKHPLGLYSKKQSVTKSINIGKDLVDAVKKETPVTADYIQTVIKRHVPESNVKIIQGKDEFLHVLESAGYDSGKVEESCRSAKALYFNFSGKAKGIYIPDLKTAEDMSHFAHEFEHYMYNEHTPKRKAFLSVVNYLTKNEPVKTNTKQIKNNFQLEQSLRKFFGVQGLVFTGGLKGVKPTKEGVDELLRGSNFAGLTDEKRVNAYIQAITRHCMHPKNRDSLPKLLCFKNHLDDEGRAYKVSDVVSRYATGAEDITWQGLISEIYSRTSPVLKRDIIKTLDYIGSSRRQKLADGTVVSPRRIQTGLPSISYVGEKAVDFSSSFGKVEGPVMKLSEFSKKPHRLKVFTPKDLTQ